MDPRSAELLELPAVRERLAGMTSFAGGRALALALAPSPDPETVAARRAETEEALLLRDRGLSGPGGASDVREDVSLAVRGAMLDAPELLAVLTTLGVWFELREAVGELDDIAPRLAEAVAWPDVGAARRVEAALARALDPRGGLLDAATAELATLRRRLAAARRTAADLMRELAVRLRSHLQESFTTERAGRPVLAVKASSRSAVPGIVHDSSGSGETIFVEPMAVVEANNEARDLQAREQQEQERILMMLSRLVGEEARVLGDVTEALARLDLALACSALSRAWRGCPVEPAGEVDLRAARHPLLDPATAVPIDLPLEGIRALVVSGPNTGGKTVALKTLGLLAMLHQCGLRVPAERARMPVFDRVLADIGDDQSIAESLSTFSAHVRRLIAIMEATGGRSLVLLDEPAAGTDPDEGARLAQAVVARLVEQGALVVATTHHPGMKAWASAAEGAANAAVGVDMRSLRPLYTLGFGEPGASHALGIAERLGLDPAVVEAARAAGPPERRALEALLDDAAAARAAAEEERDAAVAAREAAEEAGRAARVRAGGAGPADRPLEGGGRGGARRGRGSGPRPSCGRSAASSPTCAARSPRRGARRRRGPPRPTGPPGSASATATAAWAPRRPPPRGRARRSTSRSPDRTTTGRSRWATRSWTRRWASAARWCRSRAGAPRCRAARRGCSCGWTGCGATASAAGRSRSRRR